MSTATTLPKALHRNPFEVARSHLIRRILELQVPNAVRTFPSPAEFKAVADHVRQAAAIFDEWLAAIGHEVRDNASIEIDADVFDGAFVGAVDGNATYACDNAADALIHGRRLIGRA